MPLRFRPLAVLALLAMLFCAGCGAHTEQTVQRSVSPLIGTWTRDGNTSKTAGDDGPQFTKLTFSADGSLSASYVAAGLGATIGTTPSVKTENDTFKTPGGNKLSIAEGTRHLAYTYRVDGAKLYLTPPGSSDAAQFSNAE